MFKLLFIFLLPALILDSIVVSIPACHAGDRGSIPRRGGIVLTKLERKRIRRGSNLRSI